MLLPFDVHKFECLLTSLSIYDNCSQGTQDDKLRYRNAIPYQAIPYLPINAAEGSKITNNCRPRINSALIWGF